MLTLLTSGTSVFNRLRHPYNYPGPNYIHFIRFLSVIHRPILSDKFSTK